MAAIEFAKLQKLMDLIETVKERDAINEGQYLETMNTLRDVYNKMPREEPPRAPFPPHLEMIVQRILASPFFFQPDPDHPYSVERRLAEGKADLVRKFQNIVTHYLEPRLIAMNAVLEWCENNNPTPMHDLLEAKEIHLDLLLRQAVTARRVTPYWINGDFPFCGDAYDKLMQLPRVLKHVWKQSLQGHTLHLRIYEYMRLRTMANVPFAALETFGSLKKPNHLCLDMHFKITNGGPDGVCLTAPRKTADLHKIVADIAIRQSHDLPHDIAPTWRRLPKLECYTPLLRFGGCDLKPLIATLMTEDLMKGNPLDEALLIMFFRSLYDGNTPTLMKSGITASTKKEKRSYEIVNRHIDIKFVFADSLNTGSK